MVCFYVHIGWTQINTHREGLHIIFITKNIFTLIHYPHKEAASFDPVIAAIVFVHQSSSQKKLKIRKKYVPNSKPDVHTLIIRVDLSSFKWSYLKDSCIFHLRQTSFFFFFLLVIIICHVKVTLSRLNVFTFHAINDS